MTRKDYEMIAAAISDALDHMEAKAFDQEAGEGARVIADYIADGCKADNPRFDRSRFLTACGFSA